MRGVYEILIVDPEAETVEMQYVVAADEDHAKIKVLRNYQTDRDLDDLDIIVRRVGDVRPKRVTQEVRLVEK